jgi:hypothetical protein
MERPKTRGRSQVDLNDQQVNGVVLASTNRSGPPEIFLGNKVQRAGHRAVPSLYTRSNAIRYTERVTSPSAWCLGRVGPNARRVALSGGRIPIGRNSSPSQACTLGVALSGQRADHLAEVGLPPKSPFFKIGRPAHNLAIHSTASRSATPHREPLAELRRASHRELQGNPAPSSWAYSMFATSTKHLGET